MTSKVINFDEIAAEEKELRDSTPPEKKQRAVKFLLENFSEKDIQKFKEVYEKGKDSKFGWFSSYHFWGGMHIRNLLRNGGFGEEYFGYNIDVIYVELLEMVIGVRDGEEEGSTK